MLSDRRMQQRKDIPHALRQNARNQLHTGLRGREDLRHSRGRLVLQGIGVHALPLARHTGTHLPHRIHVCQRGVDRTGDIGWHQRIDASRRLGPHDTAATRHQKIVQRVRVCVILRDLHAWIVVQIEIIQKTAHQGGLDLLNLDYKIGHGSAEETVRHRDRRGGRKRDKIDRLNRQLAVALQNLALIASRHDLIKLRLTVALIIQPAIMLRKPNDLRRLVGVRCTARRTLPHAIAGQFFRAGHTAIFRQRVDLVLVVALRDKLRAGLRHNVMEAIVAIPDRARVALDPEFLRRDAKHLGLRVFLRLKNRHVMGRYTSGLICARRMLDNLESAL